MGEVPETSEAHPKGLQLGIGDRCCQIIHTKGQWGPAHDMLDPVGHLRRLCHCWQGCRRHRRCRWVRYDWLSPRGALAVLASEVGYEAAAAATTTAAVGSRWN